MLDLTIPRRDLLRLCDRCRTIANRKTTLPALSSMLLTADTSGVLVQATDMFISVSDVAACSVTHTGKLGIDPSDLRERVAAMPEGDVRLSQTERGLTVRGGPKRQFTIRTLPASEFPEMPAPSGDAEPLTIPTAALSQLLARTKFAISADETRPHVNSLCVEIGDGVIRAAATDGHRLAVAEVRVESARKAPTLLLPLRSVTEIARVLDGVESVRLSTGRNVFVEAGGATLGVKPVDAHFPPYQQVIPKPAGRKRVAVGRVQLADALKAVNVASSARTNGVRLALGGGKIRIEAEDPDTGNGCDEVEADWKHGELTIGVSAVYLGDALSALETEEVTLAFGGELDPITVQAEDDPGIYVVMPMKI